MPLNNYEELAGGREEQATQIANAAIVSYFAIRVTNEVAPIALSPLLCSAPQADHPSPDRITRHRSTPASEQS
jgi:hypothetical protein